MAILKGDKVVYAIRIKNDEDDSTDLRVLYQTDGGRSYDIEELEVNTKDIDGSDYGSVTQTTSFEGLLAISDPALEHIETTLQNKQFIEILEIHIETLEAKVGTYMISGLEFGYPDDENATYSFEGKLIGELSEETLTTVPGGATEI